MPFFCIELPEYENTISRNVARQVVRDISNVVGVDENEQIFLPGELGSVVRQDEKTGFGSSGSKGVLIELKEEDWEYNELVTNVFKKEQPPFFYDDTIDVTATPVYARTEVELNFTAYFDSKSKALRWRDAIRHKVSSGQREFLHKTNYSYIIPKEVLSIIRHCYDKRESHLGYGDLWDEYCKKYFKRRVVKYENVKTTMPSINETQEQIQGWWDFESTVDIDDQQEAGDRYEMNFTYRYQYDRPTAVSITYPYLIHNQLLDLKYIPLDPIRVGENKTKGYMSTTRFHLDGFVKTLPPKDVISGYRIPEWDVWLPSFIPNHDLSIFNIMLMLDKDNPRYLCNLLELGDYSFTKPIVKYMTANHKYLTQMNNAVIHVQLYQGNVPLGDSYIEVWQDLTVMATKDLDLRKDYHLRISLLTELRLLSNIGKRNFLSDVEAVHEVLLTLDPKLADKGLLPMALGNKIPDRYFNQALDEVTVILNNRPKGIEPIVNRINFIEVSV